MALWQVLRNRFGSVIASNQIGNNYNQEKTSASKMIRKINLDNLKA